jgi:hypothetical protein
MCKKSEAAILLSVALTQVAQADPLDTWSLANQLGSGNPRLITCCLSPYLHGITYGGGRFVAVGSGTVSNRLESSIWTSTDAMNWVRGHAVPETVLNGIIYAKGLFVLLP